MPIEEDVFENIILSDVRNEPIKEKVIRKVDGMRESEKNIRMTDAARTSLLFAGRYYFGEEWYRNALQQIQ